MIEITLNQLRQLKLTGMASALQTQRDQPGTYEGLSFAERLQLLGAFKQTAEMFHRNFLHALSSKTFSMFLTYQK